MNNMIFIIGLGPGDFNMMTNQAKNTLEQCDIIIGYQVYIDLIKEYYPNKEYCSTPMKREIERCQLCFDYAIKGKQVAMICSGDAGVYGMASPLLEIARNNEKYQEVELQVIPGITAATSGAALLGAPLNHDYCMISLSDLLTPWSLIEKRLKSAIQGDFAIAIYNPSSHKRKNYLSKACKIMIDAGADENRACGYVMNIGRKDTVVKTCTLKQLASEEVNMFTTVFIGNSQSELYTDSRGSQKIITKRGYQI